MQRVTCKQASRRPHKAPAATARQIERLHDLQRFEEIPPELAAGVELRISAGLTEDEAYELIGLLGARIARIRLAT